jgi:hypothetical protein
MDNLITVAFIHSFVSAKGLITSQLTIYPSPRGGSRSVVIGERKLYLKILSKTHKKDLA